jgi:hypothetical protein
MAGLRTTGLPKETFLKVLKLGAKAAAFTPVDVDRSALIGHFGPGKHTPKSGLVRRMP